MPGVVCWFSWTSQYQTSARCFWPGCWVRKQPWLLVSLCWPCWIYCQGPQTVVHCMANGRSQNTSNLRTEMDRKVTSNMFHSVCSKRFQTLRKVGFTSNLLQQTCSTNHKTLAKWTKTWENLGKKLGHNIISVDFSWFFHIFLGFTVCSFRRFGILAMEVIGRHEPWGLAERGVISPWRETVGLFLVEPRKKSWKTR